MLLADWYFCCSAQLRPAEAQAYLDVLEVLRRPQSAPELRVAAANQLLRAERLLQVYAIPALVEQLVQTKGQLAVGPTSERSITHVLMETVGPGMPPELRELVATLSSSTNRDIIGTVFKIADAVKVPDRVHVGRPYLDLPRYPLVVTLLALLRQIARHDPDQASIAMLGERALGFLSPARDGKFGRLPQLLVMETL